MEHEDNAQLNNFLQSSHMMENLQLEGGDGVRDNLTVDDIGGKFEGHEGHDDEEEWKYIKEVQQSEKQQQQMKAGMDLKDLDGVVEVGNGHGYGYGYEHGDVGADDVLLDHHEVGNGVVGSSAAVDVDVGTAVTGVGENEIDAEIIKNDGDFSTASNTESTAGEDVDTGVLQVEMQIEQAPIEKLLPQQDEDLLDVCGNSRITPDETEDDDPSSLATNNTNRTSSTSENIAHEAQQIGPEEIFTKNDELRQEEKENVSLLQTNISTMHISECPIRCVDLECESQSQLNPNAVEFIPSFGSNPSSPAVQPSDNSAFEVSEHSSGIGTEIHTQPHPKTMPRHLLGDDDFVAQSPRKGSGESNLDGIVLPEENDFEHEAAKRPHELEQEADLIGVGTLHRIQPHSQLNHELFENHNNDGVHLIETEINAAGDSFDKLRQSDLMDHGPETSVDIDIDIDIQTINSKEGENDPTDNIHLIEDVLNTVQPLPIDSESLNASFVEEISEQGFADKELLDVDEKENVSHSPSTEEMQLNLQNDLYSSVKNIPQIPRDMDNLTHMQESIYLENTSAEAHPYESQFDERKLETDEEEKKQENNLYVKDEQFEDNHANIRPCGVESDVCLNSSPTSLNVFAAEFTPRPKVIDAGEISPSPISTEEKHLIEETKEQSLGTTEEDLEQKMDDLVISTKDENFSQAEEIAQNAAHIIENLNPFSAPESLQQETTEQLRFDEGQPITAESQTHAVFLQQNEPNYHSEQLEQLLTSQDQKPQPAYVSEEEKFFLDNPEKQQLESPIKLESKLNGLEENIPAAQSMDSDVVTSTVQEVVEISAEPKLEQNYADQNEPSVAEPEFTSVTEQEDRVSPEPQIKSIHEPESEAAFPEPKIEAVPEPDITVIPQSEILSVNEFEVKAVAEPETKSVPEAEVVSQPESVMPAEDTETINALEISSDFVGNLSVGADESLLAPTSLETTVLESSVDEAKPYDNNVSVTSAATVGAIAATAAAATVAAAASKKSDIKQARTSTSVNSKSIDTKKTTETTKKPIAKTSASQVSARPRTAPTKTTTTTEKKTTNAVHTKPTTSTTTRKPLTTNTATPRTITKTTTTTRPTTAPAASRLTTPRTAVTTTTARRSAPTTIGGATTTSNGTTTAKPKTASVAPSKPTTLGLSGTNKPKLSSPRTTLTSQLRKAAPSTATGLPAAKSPLKTTAPTTNGVSKYSTTTTTASRAKSSASTTITSVTTTTKTFTARPAPKTTHSSTLSSTTTRRTVGSTSSSTTGTKPTSSTLQKKTPPGPTRPSTTGKLLISPTKTTNATLKTKPKEVTKKAGTPSKSSNESKPKTAEEELKTKGVAKVGEDDSAISLEQQKQQLNGGGDGGDQQLIENGTRQLDLENDEGPLTEQIQASLIDA